MKIEANQVVVVTGAGSGFGRELALACTARGMRLVLADVNEIGLQETLAMVTANGAEAVALRCDVSDESDVEALASKAFELFGAVHVLFNNAGVLSAGPLWAAPARDWNWVFAVNVMGVGHGVRHFVPRMIRQGGSAHIVNTASAGGLIATGGLGVYAASKFAVVGLSECLLKDLRQAKVDIGVSVLCPASVQTAIVQSDRNRPAELSITGNQSHEERKILERTQRAMDAGRLSAADVAQITMEGIEQGRFYIVTHPEVLPFVEQRMQGILQGLSPA